MDSEGVPEFRYVELADVLESRFPALATRLADERRKWVPDPIGGDIVLADIFVPHFAGLLRALPTTTSEVEDAVSFIDELATSSDQLLRNAARISILQALEDYSTEHPAWSAMFGSGARAMLPTRGLDGMG